MLSSYGPERCCLHPWYLYFPCIQRHLLGLTTLHHEHCLTCKSAAHVFHDLVPARDRRGTYISTPRHPRKRPTPRPAALQAPPPSSPLLVRLVLIRIRPRHNMTPKPPSIRHPRPPIPPNQPAVRVIPPTFPLPLISLSEPATCPSFSLLSPRYVRPGPV